MKNSKQSFGLQIIDICLYIYSHGKYVYDNRKILPNTFALLDYINTHTEPFMFTTNSCIMEAKFYYNKIMNSPFSDVELTKGREICAEWEKNYRERIQRRTIGKI